MVEWPKRALGALAVLPFTHAGTVVLMNWRYPPATSAASGEDNETKTAPAGAP